jgi:hypothetical protein
VRHEARVLTYRPAVVLHDTKIVSEPIRGSIAPAHWHLTGTLGVRWPQPPLLYVQATHKQPAALELSRDVAIIVDRDPIEFHAIGCFRRGDPCSASRPEPRKKCCLWSVAPVTK